MTKKEYIEKNGMPINEGIKNIELVLENCEVITLPREMLKSIMIKDFEKSFGDRAVNYIGLMDTPKYIIMQIKDSSQLLNSNCTMWFEYEKNRLLIDRLSDNDITQIYINYLWDDDQYHWFIDWGGDSDYTNELQSTIDYKGDIWIAIGEEAEIELKKYMSDDQCEQDEKYSIFNLYLEE